MYYNSLPERNKEKNQICISSDLLKHEHVTVYIKYSLIIGREKIMKNDKT